MEAPVLASRGAALSLPLSLSLSLSRKLQSCRCLDAAMHTCAHTQTHRRIGIRTQSALTDHLDLAHGHGNRREKTPPVAVSQNASIVSHGPRGGEEVWWSARNGKKGVSFIFRSRLRFPWLAEHEESWTLGGETNRKISFTFSFFFF